MISAQIIIQTNQREGCLIEIVICVTPQQTTIDAPVCLDIHVNKNSQSGFVSIAGRSTLSYRCVRWLAKELVEVNLPAP